VLVSDITGLGGMPPGRYETGLGAVEILENGRLVVAGQRQFLAGAALPIGVGVANVMRFAGLSLKGAVDLASVQPARLIGAPASQFQPGDAADLVLFDLPGADRGALGELSVRATIKRGEVVYGKLGDSK
jgi:N-acetylglucosamine-6-phosphate deacetylase